MAQKTLSCHRCGQVFAVSKSKRNGKKTFCSRACYNAYRYEQSLAICEQCGKTFHINPARKAKRDFHFCSRRCSSEWRKNRVLFVCEHCGITVERRASTVRENRHHFCSDACARAWHVGPNSPVWQGGPADLTCVHCGAAYTVRRQDANRGSKYCSLDCARKASRQKIEVACDFCGAAISRTPATTFDHNFCSWVCYAAFRRVAPENNPVWKGGASWYPYSSDFHRIRPLIRHRDSYTCQMCGASANIVHHIDYNKDNNGSSNLIVLCSTCHGKSNGNRSFWQQLFASKMEDKPCHQAVQLNLL